MIALVVVGACYLTLAGAFGALLLKRNLANCAQCSRRQSCYIAHKSIAAALGAVWPLTLPVLLGIFIASYVSTSDERLLKREQRKQADHQRRMEELKIQERMTMESVRFLVENGIKADVPGLYEAK